MEYCIESFTSSFQTAVPIFPWFDVDVQRSLHQHDMSQSPWNLWIDDGQNMVQPVQHTRNPIPWSTVVYSGQRWPVRTNSTPVPALPTHSSLKSRLSRLPNLGVPNWVVIDHYFKGHPNSQGLLIQGWHHLLSWWNTNPCLIYSSIFLYHVSSHVPWWRNWMELNGIESKSIRN
jgi:hypothetical protein